MCSISYAITVENFALSVAKVWQNERNNFQIFAENFQLLWSSFAFVADQIGIFFNPDHNVFCSNQLNVQQLIIIVSEIK